MIQYTSKLEIVADPSQDYRAISDFAIKHRCRAVVVNPDLVMPYTVEKSAKGAQYQIIATIDHPKGEIFGLDKIYRIDRAAFDNADGFDILPTPGKSQIESRNEIRFLVEFIHQMKPQSSIRLNLGMRTRSKQEVENYLLAAKEYPPHFIRTDIHTSLQDTINHANDYGIVVSHVAYPIIASGNITEIDIDANPKIDRFAVNFDQAQEIAAGSQARRQAQDYFDESDDPETESMIKQYERASGIQAAPIENESSMGRDNV